MREPIKSISINGTTFDSVPQRLNFAATDADGIIYGHESVPEADYQEFGVEGQRKHYIGQASAVGWQGTLVSI